MTTARWLDLWKPLTIIWSTGTTLIQRRRRKKRIIICDGTDGAIYADRGRRSRCRPKGGGGYLRHSCGSTAACYPSGAVGLHGGICWLTDGLASISLLTVYRLPPVSGWSRTVAVLLLLSGPWPSYLKLSSRARIQYWTTSTESSLHAAQWNYCVVTRCTPGESRRRSLLSETCIRTNGTASFRKQKRFGARTLPVYWATETITMAYCFAAVNLTLTRILTSFPLTYLTRTALKCITTRAPKKTESNHISCWSKYCV